MPVPFHGGHNFLFQTSLRQCIHSDAEDIDAITHRPAFGNPLASK